MFWLWKTSETQTKQMWRRSCFLCWQVTTRSQSNVESLANVCIKLFNGLRVGFITVIVRCNLYNLRVLLVSALCQCLCLFTGSSMCDIAAVSPSVHQSLYILYNMFCITADVFKPYEHNLPNEKSRLLITIYVMFPWIILPNIVSGRQKAVLLK